LSANNGKLPEKGGGELPGLENVVGSCYRNSGNMQESAKTALMIFYLKKEH
jgi:hypothetical protein